MNDMRRARAAYANATSTVPPIRAVVLLYDGMIKCVAAARRAIEGGRIEERFRETERAVRILTGLQGCLDFERGGEIATLLDGFYNTLFRKLQLVNIKNSTEICDDLLQALAHMRSAWEKVARGEEAPSSATLLPPVPDSMRCDA